jgi:hypothetical protein
MQNAPPRHIYFVGEEATAGASYFLEKNRGECSTQRTFPLALGFVFIARDLMKLRERQ